MKAESKREIDGKSVEVENICFDGSFGDDCRSSSGGSRKI